MKDDFDFYDGEFNDSGSAWSWILGGLAAVVLIIVALNFGQWLAID